MIARGFVTVSENKNQAEAITGTCSPLRENGEGIAILGGAMRARRPWTAAFTDGPQALVS